MAATYTKFSKDDFEKWLKREVWPLRYREGVDREIFYDVVLEGKGSNTIFIRIWTSIYANESMVRGKERRPMRIQLKRGRLLSRDSVPLTGSASAPIVKRTQGWKQNLKKRFEAYLSLYETDFSSDVDDEDEDEEEIFEAPPEPTRRPEPPPEPEPTRRTPEPEGPPRGDVPKRPRYAGPAVSDKQVKFLVSLIIKARRAGLWEDYAEQFDLPTKYVEDDDLRETLTGGRSGTASKLIGLLIEATRGAGRYATEALDELGLDTAERDLYGDIPH